jgi:hypothetical protein
MRETYTNIFGETNADDSGTDAGNTDRQRVSNFLQNYGWEYNIDLCAENERITWDVLMNEWNVIRFLNKIGYLQEKGKFEKALSGLK